MTPTPGPWTASQDRELRELAEKLEHVLVWGAMLGWRLLDRPVNIYFTWDERGYTHPAPQGECIQIFVNPKVAAEPGGEKLLKALILHELGHHHAHFDDPNYQTAFRLARRRRLKSMLNMIGDEHLERKLRSLDAEWGEMLDALCAWAFKLEPLELTIEDYARHVGAESEQAAAQGMVEGRLPGEVIAWEHGYRVAPDDEWISYPEFFDRVYDLLEQHHPRKRLNEHTRSELGRLAAQVLGARGREAGILELLLEDRFFGSSPREVSRVARLNAADALEPHASETGDPDRYLARLTSEFKELFARFPGLQRYVDELAKSRRSRWFWAKQRSMLFFMRRRRDFQFAFDPAQDLSLEELSVLLGQAEIFSPGLILQWAIERWKPCPERHEGRPWKVLLRWIETLQSPHVPPVTRFFVSLRLGLGKEGAGADHKARAALDAVPRNLRTLDMFGVLDVTQDVAHALGVQDVRDPRPAARPKPEAGARTPGKPSRTGRTLDGEGAGVGSETSSDADEHTPAEVEEDRPSSNEGSESEATPERRQEPAPSLEDLLNDALERQRSELRKAIESGKHPKLDEAIERARREAKRRIDHWLREGTLPPSKLSPPKPQARRAEPTKPYQRIHRRGPREPQSGGRGRSADMDHDLLNVAASCGFSPIRTMGPLPPDPERYRAIITPLRGQIRILRRYFATLGAREEDLHGHRAGRRIDLARVRRMAVASDPAVLVGRETRMAPDLFLGIAIDCSASMMGSDRMAKAKAFAALLLESAKSVPGVEAHAVGFTDSTLYDVGTPGSTAVVRLQAQGGNNDAAGLLQAARFALESRRERKLLVMISDGYPTDCSFESLCRLVDVLQHRYGIRSAQVAVQSLDADRIAFPHYTDLTAHDPLDAVAAFGRMVRRLVERSFRIG